MGDKITVTIIATGFEAAERRYKTAAQLGNAAHHSRPSATPERQVVHLDEDVKKPQPSLFTVTSDDAYRPVEEKAASALEFEFDNIRDTVDKIRRAQAQPSDPHVRREEEDLTPEERRKRLEDAQRRREEVRNRPINVVKLNSPQTIIELESQPAYLRKNINLDDVPDADQPSMSTWTISIDEEPEIRVGGNSFLHDNVD